MADRRIVCTALAVCLAAGCHAPDLRHSDSDGRRRALAGVCRDSEPWTADSWAERRGQILSIFQQLVPSRQDPLRPMAFDALACLGRWSNVPELVTVLHDVSEPMGIRMRAAEALDPQTADIGPSLADLAAQLSSGDESSRARAISSIDIAISSMGPQAEEVVTPLRRRLADPAAEVRARAIGALVRAGGVAAVPEIVDRLHTDDSPRVRRGAALALGTLHHRVESPETRASLVAALEKGGGDRDADVTGAVAESLRQVSQPPSVAPARCGQSR